RTPATSPLVAVHERMVADNARSIESCHRNHVRILGIGMMLAGSSQSRLEETFIAQSRASAVGRQQLVVDRDDVALLNPDRFLSLHFSLHFPFYFARARSVLRYRPMIPSAFFIFFSNAGS